MEEESDEFLLLKSWQSLCFKMISAVREFYMPGTTENEMLMPKYIRQLGVKAQKLAQLEVVAEEMAVALRHVDARGLCQHVQEPLTKYEAYKAGEG